MEEEEAVGERRHPAEDEVAAAQVGELVGENQRQLAAPVRVEGAARQQKARAQHADELRRAGVVAHPQLRRSDAEAAGEVAVHGEDGRVRHRLGGAAPAVDAGALTQRGEAEHGEAEAPEGGERQQRRAQPAAGRATDR